MNKYKNQIPRTRDLVSSLVKLSPVLRLLLSPIFFFRMHDVSDVCFFVLATLELHRRVVRGARRQRVRCGTGFSVRKILLRGRSSAQHCIYIHHDTSLSTARILDFLRAERSNRLCCRECVTRRTFHRSGSLLLLFFESSLPFLMTDRERGKNDRVTLFTGCGLLDRRPEKAIIRMETCANELLRDLYC